MGEATGRGAQAPLEHDAHTHSPLSFASHAFLPSTPYASSSPSPTHAHTWGLFLPLKRITCFFFEF